MTSSTATAAATESIDDTPRMIARVENGVGWMIYSNLRRRNAVRLSMWRQIPEIVARFQADPAVKVVALRGDGHDSFVSGADISEFEQVRSRPEDVEVYEAAAGAAGKAIKALTKPTVAVIETWCVGGGIATALSCDLRLASDNTRFQLPAARLGLGYSFGGIKSLVDVVGPAKAKEIFFTARRYDAAQALAMGLVSDVVPAADFEAEARSYLAGIAANAPLTIAAAKQAINAVMADPEDRDLDAIAAAVTACFASDDYREGRTAFTEKRAPKFQGR